MDLDLRQRAVPDRVSVTEATLQVAWDDALLSRVNGEVFELGSQYAFRARLVPVRLRAGGLGRPTKKISRGCTVPLWWSLVAIFDCLRACSVA